MCVCRYRILEKNILSVMNFPRKRKLSSITDTFEMGICNAFHQTHYKRNGL